MILDPDHWPLFWPILTRGYQLRRRVWNAEARAANPEMQIAPLPLRRSSKRKPYPGALDAEDPELG